MTSNVGFFGKERPLQSQPERGPRYDGGVVETMHHGRWVITGVSSWHYRATSPYQEIAIGEVPYMGTCLFLDGWLQLAAVDEFIYHEHLVIPALLAHPNPKRVLILGGGDGLAAREALRHVHVQHVIMVDLDAMVVSACRQYLHHLQEGAFNDPRLTIIVGDARDFLRNPGPPFDVVIVDLVDLMGTTRDLFEEVFDNLGNVINEHSIVVSHGPDPGPPLYEGLHLVDFLRRRFAHVVWFTAFITSFGETWTFGLASNGVDFAALSPETWHQRAQRLARTPRSLVPRALPARFLHTQEEEEILARLAQGHPDAPPPLPTWDAKIVDGERLIRLFDL